MTKKNILLAVTGLSPQVVTETLFGIVKADIEWPDEIQIITTKRGKEQARLGLIVDGAGKQSLLEKFCHDYKKTPPVLTEDTIFVVPDASGGEVDDARTFEDQEALADFIVSHVARLCADPNMQLHASLAGGRKTMTFFLVFRFQKNSHYACTNTILEILTTQILIFRKVYVIIFIRNYIYTAIF